jgi:Tfp pilus assembly protein PilV
MKFNFTKPDRSISFDCMNEQRRPEHEIKEQGLSLVELLIAAVILVVALVPLMRVMMYALETGSRANKMTIATNLARDLAEEIRTQAYAEDYVLFNRARAVIIERIIRWMTRNHNVLVWKAAKILRRPAAKADGLKYLTMWTITTAGVAAETVPGTIRRWRPLTVGLTMAAKATRLIIILHAGPYS